MHVRLSVCSFIFSKKTLIQSTLHLGCVLLRVQGRAPSSVNSWDLWDIFISSVATAKSTHSSELGGEPPPNPHQLLHHRRKLQGTVCSPSLATVHSRTDEGTRDQGGDIVAKAFVVLNPNILSIGDVTFGMSTFDPGNSLVPNSEQWAVTAGSWSSHISALHGQKMPAQVQPRSSPALRCSNPTRPYRHSIAPCTYKKLNWHKQKNSW